MAEFHNTKVVLRPTITDIKQYRREYYLKNKNKLKEQHHNYYLKHKDKMIERMKEYNKGYIRSRRYGISNEDYKNAYVKQKGLCGICERPLPFKSKITNVDHNHKTGKFRGILCVNCNFMLGRINEDIDILRNAINYLLGER